MNPVQGIYQSTGRKRGSFLSCYGCGGVQHELSQSWLFQFHFLSLFLKVKFLVCMEFGCRQNDGAVLEVYLLETLNKISRSQTHFYPLKTLPVT